MPDDAPPPASPDVIADLIRTLRGWGLDPGRAELVDALWLAQHFRPAAPVRGSEEPANGGEYQQGRGESAGLVNDAPAGPPVSTGPPEEEPAKRPESGRTDGRRPSAVGLYAEPVGTDTPTPGISGGWRVGVPAAGVLPDLLALERSLRPLQRYRAAGVPPAHPRHQVLDERLTVETTARAGGLLTPVFRTRRRGETELRLLMDATAAMTVWQRLLIELLEVFGRLGAFRDIQVHYLHEAPSGDPVFSRAFEPGAAPPWPVSRLSDPTGRRLTVLLSDCTGPLWRSGAAHRLLHQLGRWAPVAVVQPLPQRLWARTRLPVSYGSLRREDGPTTSVRLRFAPSDPGYEELAQGTGAGPPGALPVPVLPPTAAALGSWARLLSGVGSGPVPGAVGWARPDQPAAPRRRSRTVRSATSLVSRLRSTASPDAVQLAIYLAAAPLFLPVMQLIQRTMLPDSGPTELSEVMLSGLLRRAEGVNDSRWYEFVDGVHDELLQALGHDEALLVLKHCSGYVEQRFGKAGTNFPALALTQLTGGREIAEPLGPMPGEAPDAAEPRAPQPFAEVATRVLRRFLPEPSTAGADHGQPPEESLEVVRRAQELASTFESDGMVQHLLDAVGLLREAAQRQRLAARRTDPELWSELSEQLLRLWRYQGGAELLDEAREAAQHAASHPESVRARTVLARVLHAAAGARAAAGDRRAALELWRRADREYAAVCAAPGLPRREILTAALERVRVLEEQWRLGGDTGLLQESVGMLEAIADSWPESESRPSGLLIEHGRALLRLARSASDTDRGAAYAEQAARSLERGCEALRAESAPKDAWLGAVVELTDALLLTEHRWPEAERHLTYAREQADDPRQRAAALIRAGRLCVRRYRAVSSPVELEHAARWFQEASRAVPRDRREYSDLIAEWGDALLERSLLPDGGPVVSQAVRVLRDCRMETSAGSPQLPGRLLMLGRALYARYRHAGDLVDLREAEHLFDRAAHQSGEPLTRAWAWFELGETHRHAHRHTHRPERLEQAAEAYRAAAVAAVQAAEAGLPDPAQALRLAASALHQRGEAYEAAHRPRAAGEAYRAALEHWRRLPDDEAASSRTTARLTALTR